MKGQVILITMMMLGAAILGVVAAVSLVVRFQMRQATDILESTKAIFAADAGLEWELYRYFQGSIKNPNMTNGATYQTRRQGNQVITSIGTSGRSARALEVKIEQATSTLR